MFLTPLTNLEAKNSTMGVPARRLHGSYYDIRRGSGDDRLILWESLLTRSRHPPELRAG